MKNQMGFGTVGMFGVVALAAFLAIFGVSLLVATTIPTWVSGVLAVSAAVLVLVGK